MLDIAALEGRIEERMRAGRVPGLALAIVRGDAVLHARGFGVTSIEEGDVPVTPRTLFHIGSTTKPLTGALLLRLVEAGALELDRPMGAYLPWLRFSEPGAERVVTLRMLLSHTSGLASSAVYAGRRDPDALERYAREALPARAFVAPPGTLYSYSNDGIHLAGYLAEAAAGEPFDALMRRLVFAPLAMDRTTYDPLVAMTYPLALPHAPRLDGSLAVERRLGDNAACHPAGFLYSNVLDLANFAIMQLNGGVFRGERILAAESVALMRTPRVSLHTWRDEGYALTFRTERYKGVPLLRHHGVFQCYTSVFYLAPEHGVGVSLLFNGIAAGGIGADGIAKGIFDEMLGLPAEEAPPQPVAPERAAWPRYAGAYLGPLGGLALIRTEGDRLALDLNGAAIPLEMYATDRYYGRATPGGPLVSVGFPPAGEGPARYLFVNGAHFERFARDAAYATEPARLADLAGTYLGETGTLVVRAEDGGLMVRSVEDAAEARCVALGPARFAGSLGLFEFELGEHGAATGLTHARAYPYRRVAG